MKQKKKLFKLLTVALSLALVIAMIPLASFADGSNVKLGGVVTLSGYDTATLINEAKTLYNIEGVDEAHETWTVVGGDGSAWDVDPVVCPKEEHYHGLDMSIDDLQKCTLDSYCTYVGEGQPVQTEEMRAKHSTENQIYFTHFYHEELNSVCMYGGNTFDGEFHVYGSMCTSAHSHTTYAEGMSEGDYCQKPGTLSLRAGSSNLQDYSITEDDLTINSSFEYDGNPHGFEVTVDDAITGVEVKYGETEGNYDLDDSPTLKDAGTKTVYIQITRDGNVAYEGSVELKIEQRELELVWSDTEFEYDGTAKKPSVQATNILGSDDVRLDVSVTGESIEASETAYIATAVLSGDDAGNYKLPANPTVEFKINTPAGGNNGGNGAGDGGDDPSGGNGAGGEGDDPSGSNGAGGQGDDPSGGNGAGGEGNDPSGGNGSGAGEGNDPSGGNGGAGGGGDDPSGNGAGGEGNDPSGGNGAGGQGDDPSGGNGSDGEGKPDVNVDTNGDGKPDVNIDTDGDGKPDVNIDTDGDGKADVNVDTDGDGKPDINIDTDGGQGDTDGNIENGANGNANGNDSAETSTENSASPKTGDFNQMSVWLVILAGAAFVTLLTRKFVTKKN